MPSPNELSEKLDDDSSPQEQSLEERLQVAFPRAIGIDEFEKLFEYVTEQIQGELRYGFEGYGNIGSMFPREIEAPRRRERYIGKMGGAISARGKFPRSLCFSTQHENNFCDFARITGIQFEFPGLDYHEIPIEAKEELDLMNSVREHIRKYFEYSED